MPLNFIHIVEEQTVAFLSYCWHRRFELVNGTVEMFLQRCSYQSGKKYFSAPASVSPGRVLLCNSSINPNTLASKRDDSWFFFLSRVTSRHELTKWKDYFFVRLSSVGSKQEMNFTSFCVRFFSLWNISLYLRKFV